MGNSALNMGNSSVSSPKRINKEIRQHLEKNKKNKKEMTKIVVFKTLHAKTSCYKATYKQSLSFTTFVIISMFEAHSHCMRQQDLY